jgi:hypothetical protein
VDRATWGFILGALVASWSDLSTSNSLALWASIMIGAPAIGEAVEAVLRRRRSV